MTTSGSDWQTCDRFLELRSHWFTLIGEHLIDDRQQPLDYWRVERADSVIVLPIQLERLILPPPAYRPGISQCSLDFPGGRLPEDKSPEDAARLILQRELGVPPTAIVDLTPLNPDGWAVNSSFSNQRLYGFMAQIQPEFELTSDRVGMNVAITPEAIRQLLQTLTCLQCRALVLQWWLDRSSIAGIR
ncbi:NUDIX domain-containing protein [Pantanalinema rosaneae CENA516]|uniref:NUDIX domain-containing protein n=1 Tax=Pantanalinema rosaneae TaxID=1620701 RepID=UPI003D6FE8F0